MPKVSRIIRQHGQIVHKIDRKKRCRQTDRQTDRQTEKHTRIFIF